MFYGAKSLYYLATTLQSPDTYMFEKSN